MAVMEQTGITAELYRAMVVVIDDRMHEISVTRQDHDELVGRMDRVEASLDRLAAAQARTEQHMEELAAAQARTEQRVNELAAAQARTEQRMNELAAAQARTEQRMNELAAAQARTETQMQNLVKVVTRLDETQAGMKGNLLELTYQRRAGSYLGAVMRKVRAWVPFELETELEPRLPQPDYLDLLRADLLMRGQPREHREIAEVWLAVEVSAVVDRGDVERAVRRAGHLRNAGYLALPAVAGEQATEGAEDQAQRQGAVMILDGTVALWDQALKQALSN
jgi:hypothetical protein